MIMRDSIHVTKEAVIVGAAVLAVGSVLMILPVSWKDHPSWPYLGTFIAGFSTHWLFEIIGGNDYFCRQF